MFFARSVRTAAVAAATAGVLGALTVQPATAAPAQPTQPARPSDQPVSALLKDLQTLYVKAETASETYNATAEKLAKQRAKARKTGARLARARAALADGRTRAGRLARQQYRRGGTGLPPSVQLLLARDPQHALQNGHLLNRAAGDQAATVDRLTSGEARYSALAEKAREELAERKKLAARQKSQRDDVRARLGAVEEMLASLSGEQLEELRGLESRQTADAQRQLLSSGVLDGARAPSEAGDRALRYAVGQIGKPYVWGAEGPDSFDCSGLTSQAWQHAERAIPRTSQEQWKRLDRVPLKELRPGDLVIYFPGATHVGIYAGDGKVIQAPRPGARVKVSPLASNPLLGAVRPDADAAPMAGYVPPELPAGATAGADTGNNV
ncbi:C40 family peptidase [Streptomyces daliensis]